MLVVALVLGLIAGLLSAPATAQRKKKKRPKPVETTLYMHGNYTAGDMLEFVGAIVDDTRMIMDTEEPDGSMPKSFSYTQQVGNEQCTGNPLFPSWEGNLSGRIRGDVTWTAHFVAAPSTAIARLWVDVPFSSCTSAAAGVDDFVEPNSVVEVEIPPGQNEVEIVFEDVNGLKVENNMILQLHQTSQSNQGRVLYDATSVPTNVTFMCVPANGKSCT